MQHIVTFSSVKQEQKVMGENNNVEWTMLNSLREVTENQVSELEHVNLFHTDHEICFRNPHIFVYESRTFTAECFGKVC